eukprot:COSAG03_NODE_36_length_17658_cov_56.766900_11_plen_201_part_00
MTGGKLLLLLLSLLLLLLSLTRHGAQALGNASWGAGAYACQPGDPTAALPFCDASLDLDVRVADLVRRISNHDKPLVLTAREMAAAGVSADAAGARIPSYYWGTNCLQSVENNAHQELDGGPAGVVPRCPSGRCATHFPSPPNMNAAMNRTLVAQIGNTMATELRALFNVGAAAGLDCWGPVLNVLTHPLARSLALSRSR